MSTNTYNIMSPVIVDPNRYKLSDLKIEFKKDFKKSYNILQNTGSYTDYTLIPNTNNIYLPTEIEKNDPVSYIKLKDKDLWLHMDDSNNFFFDKIRMGDYYYRKPLIVWFNYNKGDEMVMYKYFGKGLPHINETKNEGISNIMYINYKQVNNDIYMKWVYNINDATKIITEKVQPSECMWKTKVSINKHRHDLL